MSSPERAATASRPTLDEVTRRVQEISTLPQVAIRVMEVANDPESGAGELKQCMESDTALSARVLRWVNSSAYAARTKITNLQQAIAYLGMQQIRNLAMTASVSKLFGADETIGLYRRANLWKHLVSVGVCSRLIAMRAGFAHFEDVFLAGLLHDVGIILENQYVCDDFKQVVQSLESGKTLSEVERLRLGFDHTELAASVAKTWGFPDAILATVRYHHGSAAYRGPDIDTIRCVEVANLICSLKGITSVGVNLVQFPTAAVAGLQLSKNDVLVLIDDLDRELESNSGLFQM